MSSEEKCQLCGCVGYSDHREGPEEVSCVCERDWVTVVHQHSSALFLNRSDTSGSPCTSRHTGEPCEGCAHRRSSAKHSQTRTGGLAGKNTHKHSGLYYIGHDSSCIKQKDGDRCLGGEKDHEWETRVRIMVLCVQMSALQFEQMAVVPLCEKHHFMWNRYQLKLN